MSTYKLPTLLKINDFKKLAFPFLAGLLDGDGHIIPRKSSGEIRLVGHQLDLALFSQLQQQFGGEVRKEAKKQAIRYFLNMKNAKNGKDGVIAFVNGLNGHIRNNIRIEQFKKLCYALNIEYKIAEPLNTKDGYIAGLFVSDGSIFFKSSLSAATKKSINKSEDPFQSCGPAEKKLLPAANLVSCPKQIVDWIVKTNQEKEKKIQRVSKGVGLSVVVRIANKHVINLEFLPKAFGFGKITHDTRGWYSFILYSKADILNFVDYMEINSSLSVKHKRLDLVKKVYDCITKKANFAHADPTLVAEWRSVLNQWYS